MKKIILLMGAVIFILTGCGTVAGVGQDIERGGRALEKAANRAAR